MAFIIISGFKIGCNNRGTEALSYGALSFLKEYGYMNSSDELLNIQYVKRFWKKEYRTTTEIIRLQNQEIKRTIVYAPIWERYLFSISHVFLPFSVIGKVIKKIKLVAAINGGDGFSDIYGTKTFLRRLDDTLIAMYKGIPLILLPQTIGPFGNQTNKEIADKILSYANMVFVRDDKYCESLKVLNVQYELTKDLSAYMHPEPFDIMIEPNSIGINVSGLAYSNGFRSLSGQFDLYPKLVAKLIAAFQEKHTVYLIPHSYNYDNPEDNNDDYVACKDVYENLENKHNVVFIDKNLHSPHVKYVISKMSFFIGTRMHANFAAIYTGVPVFGLAYSYKFEGAFNNNGLNGEKQTSLINNISEDDIPNIISKIIHFYNEVKES